MKASAIQPSHTHNDVVMCLFFQTSTVSLTMCVNRAFKFTTHSLVYYLSLKQQKVYFIYSPQQARNNQLNKKNMDLSESLSFVRMKHWWPTLGVGECQEETDTFIRD